MQYDVFLKSFGKEIKKLRIDKDLSQEDLADKASIHVTLLSRIENGKANVTIENIFKIASSLNVTLCDLFKFQK